MNFVFSFFQKNTPDGSQVNQDGLPPVFFITCTWNDFNFVQNALFRDSFCPPPGLWLSTGSKYSTGGKKRSYYPISIAQVDASISYIQGLTRGLKPQLITDNRIPGRPV